MKTLPFPIHHARARDVASRIALVDRLLTECLGRQSSLREDGRRLRCSLERLSALTRNLAREAETLRRSARRLLAGHRRIGPPAVSA